MNHSPRFLRIAEMLASVQPLFDKESRDDKAEIARAMIGSINPPKHMAAICECGWRGTISDCDERQYNNGVEAFMNHAGRNGYHWHCPTCDEIVWKWYYEIN